MTRLLVRWGKKAPLHSPKPHLSPKRSWSLFSGLPLIWCSIAFWIPMKTLSLRRVFGNLMGHIRNCKGCHCHWPIEMAPFHSTTPSSMSPNQCFRGWTCCSARFCLIHHIHLASCHPPSLSSCIPPTPYRENAPSANRMHKMLSKSLSNPEAQILYHGNKQTSFSLAKTCCWIWFPFWLIKMSLSIVRVT